MGRRRVRNLLNLGVASRDIFAVEPDPARRKEAAAEYHITTLSQFEGSLEKVKPAALVISTPPDRHAPFFLTAARRKINFFVEVPTTDDGYAELEPLLDDSFVAAPSCTFRYYPAVKKIKALLMGGAIGKPLVFIHYLGQYLPDWHPYEDYRQVYFAKKNTGGAVEMFAYDLVWLTDIFTSPVQKITGIKRQLSDLEITADDCLTGVVELTNLVTGTMLVDLFNRRAERTLKIVGSSGTLDWNWLGYTITIYRAATKQTETVELSPGRTVAHFNTAEDAYQEEMKDFLTAVRVERPFPYSFGEDWKILKAIQQLQ